MTNPWKNKIGERRANKVRRRSWRIEESMEMDKKSSSENWLRKSSRWLIVSMGNRDSNWSFRRKSWNVCVRSLSNSKDLRKRNQWLVQKRVFTHQRYRLRSEFINHKDKINSLFYLYDWYILLLFISPYVLSQNYKPIFMMWDFIPISI